MILEQQQQHTKIVSAESQISIADLLLSIINIDLLLAALADGRFFFLSSFYYFGVRRSALLVDFQPGSIVNCELCIYLYIYVVG